MAVRIQFRRGTSAEWFSTNPILSAGEVGFETDTRKFKIGTGDKRWNDIDFPYYAQGTITSVIAGGGLTGGGDTGEVTLSLDSDVLTGTVFNNRGDLLTATANNEPALLPAGETDFDVLRVDSTSVLGLSYGKVRTSSIENNAITEAKLGGTSVTTSKIQNGAVTEDKLGANSVTTVKIDTNAVTSTKIAGNAVTSDKIINSAITTDKIADLAVTGSKFADNTITTAKIANGTILNEDINASAAIALTKLGTGALPTAITVTTDNYIDRSVTAVKLSNTAGATGVGVWQNFTPVVYINGAQPNTWWTPLYCKYMRLNNYCTVQFAVRMTNLTAQNNRTFKFGLPLTPVFSSALGSREPIIIGTILHFNEDTRSANTIRTAVFVDGLVESWTESGETTYNTTEPGDVISFSATYEVA